MLGRRKRALRILITNNSLGPRSGTSMFVHDLALGLIRRGHNPVAYSPELGPVAEMMRAQTIPVVDDLRALTAPPDIIHAQHHHEAMTALMRFPDTPAIQVCHGWAPWQEAPAPFPTVMRYIGADALCRERLLTTPGIDPDRVGVIHNFVDMKRFYRVRNLPERPRRALVFTNYAREIPPAIAEACARDGIEVEIAGRPAGNEFADPENRLADYDIVFAKAKAAMEAMASGCAVVLMHLDGLGGMVTSDRAEDMHALNFGIRNMQASPLTAAAVERALAEYDAADAARVTRWIRREADMETAIDQWVAVHEDALGRWKRDRLRITASDRFQAASAYLRSIAGLVKESHRNFGLHQRSEMRCRELEAQLAEAERGRQKAELALDAAPRSPVAPTARKRTRG